MPVENVTALQFTCSQCGHKWFARAQDGIKLPQMCPSRTCTSRKLWNREAVNGKGL